MTRTERLKKLSAQFAAAADDVAEYDEGETSLTCNVCGNLTRAFHCSSCLRLVSDTLKASADADPMDELRDIAAKEAGPDIDVQVEGSSLVFKPKPITPNPNGKETE